ncbi:Hypothetical predicted protein [Olea europaea subsp. europaea]|uniref:Uncharacterized protein n=1 Tax=Olea europaea subsp. europaea TaxID=158383 RepID=A0A8S0S5U0_OLEEU|nr:Hypothetical predicted protein [Olea europaea subsp. europaea]
MGRTLRLIAYSILVALMVSHEVQAMMTCWDRCVDACRDEQVGFTCVPQCFYGNCLNMPTGVAVPLFVGLKNQNQHLEQENAYAPNPSSSDAYAPNPSSLEHNRKFMKDTN